MALVFIRAHDKTRPEIDKVGGLVAHEILVSAPVPLGIIRSLNWIGLGWA